jgi:4-phospho-D-threonate 3-dehydrogenase / 4-phospho-D-erythronate 3-dehydrogenase
MHSESGARPIAITMGDPAGVGPEVIAAALAALPPAERAGISVVGSTPVLERAAAVMGAAVHFRSAAVAADAAAVPVHEIDLMDVGLPPDATVAAAGGEAAYRAIQRAVTLALDGTVGCIVTAPLNKAALHAAGHVFDGHTELLSHLSGGAKPYMLLSSPTLSTIHVSTHCSLGEAVRRCTAARVLEVIEAADRHFRRLGVARPRIGVAGLNPHAGEGGIFGTEDRDAIAPAVGEARAQGIDATGPVPGDVVFHQAHRGRYDVVVAQYHDQGHATVKLIAFDTAVNVTVGLPIDRCSVDHGTAFDIAWQGRADATNMLSAIAYGRRLADARRDVAA